MGFNFPAQVDGPNLANSINNNYVRKPCNGVESFVLKCSPCVFLKLGVVLLNSKCSI